MTYSEASADEARVSAALRPVPPYSVACELIVEHSEQDYDWVWWMFVSGVCEPSVLSVAPAVGVSALAQSRNPVACMIARVRSSHRCDTA